MSLFATLALAPALVLLQDPAAAPVAAPATAAPQPLFSMWIDDMPGLMPSPKDAGLVAALAMMDGRLLDLLSELEGEMPPLPPQAIGVATKLMMGRKSLRVYPSNDPSSPLPVFVQLELQQDSPQLAQQLAGSVVNLLTDMGMPVSDPRADGSRLVEMPDMPPIALQLAGPNFVVSLGGSTPAPGRPTLGALPSGVRPTMSMHLDIGAISEMALGFIESQASADEAEQLATMFDAYGLQNLVMQVDMGSDAERSYSVVNMPGYGATMRSMGMLPDRGLTEADYSMVPTDAEWAQLSTLNASGLLDYMLEVMSPTLEMQGIEDPLGMVLEMTGFDLRTDIVDNLGTTMAMYTSRTTGGGGMLSTVATMELANSDGMLATLNRARGMIDQMAADEADGYVRVRGWEHDGTPLMTLTFPGLPIPLEATLAVTGTHLVAGMTPQATLSAIAHMKSGGAGLLANAGFRSQLPGDPIGAMGAQFVDIPQLAGDSYGLASLVCSAIGNAMRSPSSTREPGLIMPSYAELMHGAKPMVVLARVVGDDLIEEGRSDSSMLVNMAGMVGMFASSPLGLLVGAGMLGGAFGQAQSSSATAYPDWDSTEYDFEAYEPKQIEEVEEIEEVIEEEPLHDLPEPAEQPVGGGGH